MTWLIWKEYRVNRLILGVGLMLLLLPHVIALAVGIRHPDNWSDYFQGSMAFSFYVSPIVLALLGGNAIAGERVDRSAEFLACLPISRRRNLASKLLLAPLAVIAIWGVNLLILLFVSGLCPDLREMLRELWEHQDEAFRQEVLLFFGCIAGTSLTFFCASWLASSLLNSPTYSVLIGLITPLMVILGIQAVVWWRETQFTGRWEEPITIGCWYTGMCMTLSLGAFVAGTWYYVRRVEP